MSAVEVLDIIDTSNNVVGQATKEDVYKYKQPHRTVYVMVCFGDKVFIPKRSLKVKYLPGYYCSSAAGHVQSGESSYQGALRELQEEIGLNGPIELVSEYFYEHEFLVHASIFIKRFDPNRDSISLDKDEVLSGEFYSLQEIAQLDSSLFHPQLQLCVEEVKRFL